MPGECFDKDQTLPICKYFCYLSPDAWPRFSQIALSSLWVRLHLSLYNW